MIRGIPASEVPDVWPEAKILLKPATNRSLGRYDTDSLLEKIIQREMQLWCAWDKKMIAAAVTQINIWPTGIKTARLIVAGGGQMEKWIHGMNIIEAWAKQNGCSLLEAGGRPGWKILGWEQTAVEFVKELNDA